MSDSSKKIQVQQGDVCIESISELPKGLKKLEHNRLAEGEVTGHSHKLNASGKKATVAVYEHPTTHQKFFEVKGAPVTLVHEEHGQHTFDPGTYETSIVQEFDYETLEANAVRD
jgi:hypothetical protein